MKLFSRYSVSVAGRSMLYLLTCILLSLFIGSGSLSDNVWLGWGLFAGFVIIYYFIAYLDGSDRGARDAQITARNAKLTEQGHGLTQDMMDRAYSLKKGLAIALMIGSVGFVLALLSLVTWDGVIGIRAAMRFYLAPFLKLYGYLDGSPALCVLSYLVLSASYPAMYLLGYSTGPKQYQKQCDVIRQNDEDYKKGIRRRRKTRKPRRRFFW